MLTMLINNEPLISSESRNNSAHSDTRDSKL